MEKWKNGKMEKRKKGKILKNESKSKKTKGKV